MDCARGNTYVIYAPEHFVFVHVLVVGNRSAAYPASFAHCQIQHYLICNVRGAHHAREMDGIMMP